MGEKFLYIDDSGQLTNNGTHEFFLYSGIFVGASDSINELKRRINGFANKINIKGEIKGTKLGGRHRRTILNILSEAEDVYVFFVIEKTSLLTKMNFGNPQKVRYHKNYLIRRLIEKIIDHDLVSDQDTLHTYIDNEALSDTNQAFHLTEYLNKYWNRFGRGTYQKHYEYGQYIPYCGVNIKVKYLDSKSERMIQLADIVANTKYKRFCGKKRSHSELLNTHFCLKLPDNANFYSPKSCL